MKDLTILSWVKLILLPAALFCSIPVVVCLCLKERLESVGPAKTPKPDAKVRQPPPINEVSFRKLRWGMTRRDVERILGKPEDRCTIAVSGGIKEISILRLDGQIEEIVTEARRFPPFAWDGHMTSPLGALNLRWKDNHGVIGLIFDKGRAVVLCFRELVPGVPHPLRLWDLKSRLAEAGH